MKPTKKDETNSPSSSSLTDRRERGQDTGDLSNTERRGSYYDEERTVVPAIQRVAGNQAIGKWMRYVAEVLSRTRQNPRDSIDNALRTSGERLPAATQEKMESRLGYKLGSVRLHTGARAAESARQLNARAFTVGNDIVFGAGEYAPTTRYGERLLAHELAHVVQQGPGGTAPPDSTRREGLERAAEQAANAVISSQDRIVGVAGASGVSVLRVRRPRYLDDNPDPWSMSDAEIDREIYDIRSWIEANPDDWRCEGLFAVMGHLQDIANERQHQRLLVTPPPTREPESKAPYGKTQPAGKGRSMRLPQADPLIARSGGGSRRPPLSPGAVAAAKRRLPARPTERKAAKEPRKRSYGKSQPAGKGRPSRPPLKEPVVGRPGTRALRRRQAEKTAEARAVSWEGAAASKEHEAEETRASIDEMVEEQVGAPVRAHTISMDATLPGEQVLLSNRELDVRVRAETRVTATVTGTSVQILFSPALQVMSSGYRPTVSFGLQRAGYMFGSGRVWTRVEAGVLRGRIEGKVQERIGQLIESVIPQGMRETEYDPYEDEQLMAHLSQIVAMSAGTSAPATGSIQRTPATRAERAAAVGGVALGPQAAAPQTEPFIPRIEHIELSGAFVVEAEVRREIAQGFALVVPSGTRVEFAVNVAEAPASLRDLRVREIGIRFSPSARGARGSATADVRVLDTSIPVPSFLLAVEGATVSHGGRVVVHHRLLGRQAPPDVMEVIDRELVGPDIRRLIRTHRFVIPGLDLIRTLGLTST